MSGNMSLCILAFFATLSAAAVSWRVRRLGSRASSARPSVFFVLALAVGGLTAIQVGLEWVVYVALNEDLTHKSLARQVEAQSRILSEQHRYRDEQDRTLAVKEVELVGLRALNAQSSQLLNRFNQVSDELNQQRRCSWWRATASINWTWKKIIYVTHPIEVDEDKGNLVAIRVPAGDKRRILEAGKPVLDHGTVLSTDLAPDGGSVVIRLVLSDHHRARGSILLKMAEEHVRTGTFQSPGLQVLSSATVVLSDMQPGPDWHDVQTSVVGVLVIWPGVDSLLGPAEPVSIPLSLSKSTSEITGTRSGVVEVAMEGTRVVLRISGDLSRR